MTNKSFEYQQIVRPSILKRDNYSCRSCKIRNKARVYLTTRGKYVECDDFIEAWALANGKKVFSIGLQVVMIDPFIDDYTPFNLLTLCQQCAAKQERFTRKLLKSSYQEELEQSIPFNYSKLDLEEVNKYAEIRRLIEHVSGVTLPTKELARIVFLLKNIK